MIHRPTVPITVPILGIAMGVAALMTSASAGLAGPIERACLSSARPGANPALCSCIQQVADLTLARSDQRRAARFFRDPDMAQRVRQSSDRANSEFWKRYVTFGATAERYCG